jgi:hypothetical protein
MKLMNFRLSRFNRQIFEIRPHFWVLGTSGFCLLAYIVNSISPKQGTVILLVLFLLVATMGSFLLSCIKNVRRVLLATSGVGVLLTLRLLGLTSPLYIILLIVLLISLEYALKRR